MIVRRTFIDTNVLVYAVDAGEQMKRERAMAAIAGLSGRFAVSTQVLGEFWVTVTAEVLGSASRSR